MGLSKKMCWKWKYPLVNGLLKSNNWLIVISTDNVYVGVCEDEEKAKKMAGIVRRVKYMIFLFIHYFLNIYIYITQISI